MLYEFIVSLLLISSASFDGSIVSDKLLKKFSKFSPSKVPEHYFFG